MANEVEGVTLHAGSGGSGGSGSSNDEDEEERGVSSYEQQRLENIRRNRDKMRSLNLLTHGITSTIANTPPAQSTKRAKRQPALPSRRSLRLAQQGPRPSLKEPSPPPLPRTRARTAVNHAASEGAESQAEFWRNQPSSDGGDHPHSRDDGSSCQPGQGVSDRSPARHGRISSKLLHANIACLLKEYLGQHVPRIGGQVKRAVMEVAAAPNSVKFNRMSGIQEWHNAVFLFVNVDPTGYNNVFLDGGQLITWFAQPTQQPTTPVIEKLLRLGNHDADAPEGKKKGGSFAGANQNTRAVEGKDKDGVLQPHQQQNEARSPARGGGPRTKASSRRRDAHSDTRANEEKATSKREAEGAGPHSAPSPHLRDRHESEDGTVSGADASDVSGCVMLFCRHPGQDYVCLGRLQREKTDLSARPMRVLWRLRDHAALRKHSSAFRAMCCVDDTAAP